MRIRTSRGKTLEINYIWPEQNGRVMIELEDARPLSEIAADFDGVETLVKTDEKKPGVEEVYSGFTELIIASKDNYVGVTRLTMRKP